MNFYTNVKLFYRRCSCDLCAWVALLSFSYLDCSAVQPPPKLPIQTSPSYKNPQRHPLHVDTSLEAKNFFSSKFGNFWGVRSPCQFNVDTLDVKSHTSKVQAKRYLKFFCKSNVIILVRIWNWNFDCGKICLSSLKLMHLMWGQITRTPSWRKLYSLFWWFSAFTKKTLMLNVRNSYKVNICK